jgi:hypothetical protein
MRWHRQNKILVVFLLLLTLIISNFPIKSFAQDNSAIEKDTVDVGDIWRSIFKKKTSSGKKPKKAEMAILPTVSYNPSFGLLIGGSIDAGTTFGKKPKTIYSTFTLSASVTTKGDVSGTIRHNIFTPGNNWNLQGNWQITTMGIVDYGMGTGQPAEGFQSRGFALNELPTQNSDSSFPMKYNLVRVFEKAYHEVGEHLFVGAGLNINMFWNILDERHDEGVNTPHLRYSERNDFDTMQYSANGFVLAFQYNKREHPVRSYGGFYADVNVVLNQTLLGSSKNSTVLIYDLRKYFSLSKKNPENVIALWHWASYKIGGTIPYLEMPGTAHDTYGRTGRGYTYGRFKGPSFAYFEAEWRFPITRNKLISGVCFYNLQTASDDLNKKIFQSWEMAGGVGLRILFVKTNRTNLCVDFAQGNYNSRGLFFGTTEVF